MVGSCIQFVLSFNPYPDEDFGISSPEIDPWENLGDFSSGTVLNLMIPCLHKVLAGFGISDAMIYINDGTRIHRLIGDAGTDCNQALMDRISHWETSKNQESISRLIDGASGQVYGFDLPRIEILVEANNTDIDGNPFDPSLAEGFVKGLDGYWSMSSFGQLFAKLIGGIQPGRLQDFAIFGSFDDHIFLQKVSLEWDRDFSHESTSLEYWKNPKASSIYTVLGSPVPDNYPPIETSLPIYVHAHGIVGELYRTLKCIELCSAHPKNSATQEGHSDECDLRDDVARSLLDAFNSSPDLELGDDTAIILTRSGDITDDSYLLCVERVILDDDGDPSETEIIEEFPSTILGVQRAVKAYLRNGGHIDDLDF